jgi:hypothetical protein
MAHKALKQQLDAITFDGAQRRPKRDLIADTLTFGIDLDLSAQVDVAAGGGADGTLVKEQPDGLLPTIRIFDNSREPVVEVSASELRQMQMRQVYGQAAPGVPLAIPGIQAATLIRRKYRILFADPRSENPIETALRPRDPKNFYIELEWPGTDDSTNGDLAAALISGGTRDVDVSDLKVDIMQIHDPDAFNRVLPIYMPRIRRYEYNIPATSPNFQAPIKTGADGIRAALLHGLDAGVTTEGIFNKISLRTDREYIREFVEARAWHEYELTENSALEDEAGIAMAYFGDEYADNGRLGTILRPYQGGNLRYMLDVNGSATRLVRLVQWELERIEGLVAPLKSIPAALLD